MNTYLLISADQYDGWGTAGNISFGGITQAESIEEAITEKFACRPFREDNVFESCLMDDASADEYNAWENSNHPFVPNRLFHHII